MKSSLVFVDSYKNSKRGTLRGLIIFPIFIIITILWFTLTKPFYKKYLNKNPKIIIPLLFTALLIVSALGVHNPNTIIKAIVYGKLVGFVIYGIACCALLYFYDKWDYKISIITIIWGILSTALLAYILYIAVKHFPQLEYN